MSFKSILAGLMMGAMAIQAVAAEGSCFIKDGDRVGFFGDSITAAKVYGELVERVFRHAHPEAKVEFVNNGQGGLQLAATKLAGVTKGDPNVITIMIGMNDAINSDWVAGDPLAPKLAVYREQLTALVRELKALDKVVVLMSPTLTDETISGSVFRLEGTEALLREMGVVCAEVAQAEGVFFVPVAEEMEAYDATIARYADLRPDGVHPCARGHYQIARSLWTHLNLGAPLAGERTVEAAPRSVDLAITPPASLLPSDATPLALTLRTASPGPVTVTWSASTGMGAGAGSSGAVKAAAGVDAPPAATPARATAALTLTGEDTWTLPLPASALPPGAGTSTAVVLEFERDGARSFFVLDLFRRAVVHGKDGKAEAPLLDADGKTVATYRWAKEGKALRFEATVEAGVFVHTDAGAWPWDHGEFVNLLLDLREESAFADLGFDGDVFQTWFTPSEAPYFSPGFTPWAGRHMLQMARAYGERTATGYTVGMLLTGNRNIKEPVDYSKRRFVGIEMAVNVIEAPGKAKWLNMQTTDRPTFLFPGAQALVDLEGAIPADTDTALTLSLFPGAPTSK